MPPRTPRRILVDDWHRRLLDALEARYDMATQRNYRTQGPLRQAIEALRRSAAPIHVQKGGNNKGLIKGIPNNINTSILQLMYRIIKGEEPVIPAGYGHDIGINYNRNANSNNNPRIVDDVSQDVAFKRRRYRDSAYALLAGLWEKYDGSMGRDVGTEEWKRRASRYCDYEMDYDYRTRQHGAFKAKAQLVANGYVVERSDGGFYHRSKHYYLTDRGSKLCYLLFNDKFHPSKGDYPLVQPVARCFTREEIFNINYNNNNNQNNNVINNYNHNNIYHDVEIIIDDFRSLKNNNLLVNSPHARAVHTPVQLTTIYNEENEEIRNAFDRNYNLDIYNIVNHDNNQSIDNPVINEGTRIRRVRLLKLDPHCKEKIIRLMSMGVAEDDAWVLYEHGATDEAPPTSFQKNNTSEHGINNTINSSDNHVYVEGSECWQTPQKYPKHNNAFIDLTPSARNMIPSQHAKNSNNTQNVVPIYTSTQNEVGDEETALMAAITASEHEQMLLKQALLVKQQLQKDEHRQLQTILAVSEIEENIRVLEAQVGLGIQKMEDSSFHTTHTINATMKTNSKTASANNPISTGKCIDLTPNGRNVSHNNNKKNNRKNNTTTNNAFLSYDEEEEPVTTIDLSEYDENGFAFHQPDYSGIDEFVIVIEDEDNDTDCNSYNRYIMNSNNSTGDQENKISCKETKKISEDISSFGAVFKGERDILSEDVAFDFDSFHDNFLKKKMVPSQDNNKNNNNNSSSSYSAMKTKVKSKAIVVSAKEYTANESREMLDCLDLTESVPIDNRNVYCASYQNSRMNSLNTSRSASPRAKTMHSTFSKCNRIDNNTNNNENHYVDSIDLCTSQNGYSNVRVLTPVYTKKHNNNSTINVNSINIKDKKENLADNTMDLTGSQPLYSGAVSDLDSCINELESLQRYRQLSSSVTKNSNIYNSNALTTPLKSPMTPQRQRSRSNSSSSVNTNYSNSKNNTNKIHVLKVIFEDIEDDTINDNNRNNIDVITIDENEEIDPLNTVMRQKDSDMIAITNYSSNSIANNNAKNHPVEVTNLTDSLPENADNIIVISNKNPHASSSNRKRNYSTLLSTEAAVNLEEMNDDNNGLQNGYSENAAKRRVVERFACHGQEEVQYWIENHNNSNNNSPRKLSVFATLLAKQQQKQQTYKTSSHLITSSKVSNFMNNNYVQNNSIYSNDSIKLTSNNTNITSNNTKNNAIIQTNNNTSSNIYSILSPNYSSQWQRLYDTNNNVIHTNKIDYDASSVVLVVDQRERSKNAYYRDMITTLAHTLQRYSSVSHINNTNNNNVEETVGLREMKLTLGDFCFALKTPGTLSLAPPCTTTTTSTKSCSKNNTTRNTRKDIDSEEEDNEDELLLYHMGVSIERKTLNDIFSRSASAKEYTKYRSQTNSTTAYAINTNNSTNLRNSNDIDRIIVSEKDAPHFKQEKHLRNSGFVDNFLLLEGNFLSLFSDNDRRRFMYRPMVSSKHSERDLQKKDVLNDGEDLLRYLAGLLVRNTSGFIISPPNNANNNAVNSGGNSETAAPVQSVAHQVTILFSLDVKFTCVLLAALGTVLAQKNQHLHAKTNNTVGKFPLLQTVSRHWYWTRIRDRLTHLQQLISNYNNSNNNCGNTIIGKDMFEKLIRRFGEETALFNTLSLCFRQNNESNIDCYFNAELLCHGLSSAAANPLSNDNNNDSYFDSYDNDNSYSNNTNNDSTSCSGGGRQTEDWQESAAVAHCILHANNQRINNNNNKNNINIFHFKESDGRTTFVGMSEVCSERCDHLKGFPSHFHPFCINKTAANNTTSTSNNNDNSDIEDALVSWNEIIVRETCHIDSNGNSNKIVRASAPVFTVVLPGYCVVAALGMAYDQLSERQREVSPVAVTQRAVALIEEEWLPVSLRHRIVSYHYFSQSYQINTNSNTTNSSTINSISEPNISNNNSNNNSKTAPSVTLVYLVENLGHGRSHTGAVGRLHNALVKHNYNAGNNASSNGFIFLNPNNANKQRYKSGQNNVQDTFEVLSTGRVSAAAAQYISDRAIWLVALLSAQCMLSSSLNNINADNCNYNISNINNSTNTNNDTNNEINTNSNMRMPRDGMIRQWWPVSDSSGVCPAETVIAFILHEMHEQALLPYSY